MGKDQLEEIKGFLEDYKFFLFRQTLTRDTIYKEYAEKKMLKIQLQVNDLSKQIKELKVGNI